ncbi:MAG TPA: hypothetical protein VFS16_00915 [Acidimicrobiia bacterium]|nr:hypothetical protein [Acidimicrobiia bacterium]
MPGTDVDGLLRSGVASLCLAAGVLHMSAAADHAGMTSHTAFFVLVAVGQSLLAAAVLWGRPGRWLAAAAGANLAVVLVWVLSRTTGLPVDGTSAPEAIGFKDGISTLLEIGVLAGAALWWALPEAARGAAVPSRRLASTLLGTGVWALGASGLFAGHTHSAGHTHGAAHAHGTDVGTDHHAHPAHPAEGPQHAPAADAAHHGAHAPPADAGPAVAPLAGAHAHPAGSTHGPSTPDGHRHAGDVRRAGSGTTAAAPGHDHTGAHDHAGHAAAPGPSAAHQHPDAGTGAAPGHGHDPAHAGDHPHGHGSGADHDHGDARNRPDDRRREREDDDGGAPSPLDDVLKLIRTSRPQSAVPMSTQRR